MRGADKSLALWRKQQAMGLKKYIYSTYSPLSSTHLWLRCSNFLNPPKKNSFGCAANRKIGNMKSQRLISTPMYKLGHVMAPKISCWFLTTAAKVWSQVRSCWIYGRRCGSIAGFLQVLQFLLPIFITRTASYSLIILWPMLYSLNTDSVAK
jgi:hypothetical protein